MKMKKITRDRALRTKVPNTPYNLIPRNRSGQEEIVGFVVIIVIVAIALVILLWFLLNSSSGNAVEDFEVESFIQTALQYTTDCEDYVEFLSVQNLIVSCEEQGKCLDGQDSCVVLNKTLTDIVENSWNVSKESAVKGYKIDVLSNNEGKISINKGNQTTNYKGAFQDFARAGTDYKVSINIYY
jgi:hypothetical protein